MVPWAGAPARTFTLRGPGCLRAWCGRRAGRVRQPRTSVVTVLGSGGAAGTAAKGMRARGPPLGVCRQAGARRRAFRPAGPAVGGRAGHLCGCCCFRARWARPGRSAAALAPGLRGWSFLLVPAFPWLARPVTLAALESSCQSSAVHEITSAAGVRCLPFGRAPRSPPHALRAPRWYIADTPAAHRAGGPVRWAGNERLAVTRAPCSPIHRPLTRASGPGSLTR